MDRIDLPPGEVQLWWASLDVSDSEIGRLRGMLAPAELQRADRFRIAAAARRFVGARAALRMILCRATGAAPAEVEFLFGERGKRRIRAKEMTFAQLMGERKKELALEADSGSGMTKRRLELQVHIQKNFAMAFSVFSLAIFGVPLAIQVGRKETYANLGIALVIAMSYYFLMIIVSWMESNPALRADLLIWLPNIIFQSVGFWLIHKASRH